MGRLRKYFTKEERNEANRPTKTKYMLNKVWICHECGDRNYTMAGKWNHLKTKKHKRNEENIILTPSGLIDDKKQEPSDLIDDKKQEPPPSLSIG